MSRRWTTALLSVGLFCGLLVAHLAFEPPQARASDLVYVVQQGDALSRLARQYDVSVQQLRQWNDLSGDTIRVGQELRIHPGQGTGGGAYVVAPGDTLSAIAQRHGVSVGDIVGLNRDINPDRIRVGQELRIPTMGRARRRITHEVQPGDFVARIARRYNTTVDEIVRWNSGLDPDRVRIGQQLTIYVEGPEERSESVGRANDGRLVNGEQLPPHPGYEVRNFDLAWGANETITSMLDGFNAVQRRYPDAPRVRVHDLSRESGGRLRGHRSHQSGRDADLGYYQRDCRGTCEYRNIRPSELDVEVQWTLIRHWINHDQVDYIFMDYSLQRPLYEYVRDVRGATSEQLREWFQYPSGRNTARGLIRHWPNHRDHLHVRFACPDTDERCR